MIFGSHQRDWGGSLWEQRRPQLDISETFRGGIVSGLDNALTWELLGHLRNSGSRTQELIENDPREAEILSPEQVVEEFPNILKPQKTSMVRAEARYLEERDVEASRVMQAYVGRDNDSLTSMAAQMGGNVLGFATDPLNLGSAFIPYAGSVAFGTKLSQIRRVLLAAKMNQTTAKGRAGLGVAAAADNMMGAAAYGGVQALSRHMLINKPYGWGDFGMELGAAGVLGGGFGMAFPKQTTILFQAIEDRNFLAALSSWQKQMGRKGSAEILKFFKDSSGQLDLDMITGLFRGQEARPRSKKSISLDGLRFTRDVAPAPAQELGRWAKTGGRRDLEFRRYFQITQDGVRNYGGGNGSRFPQRKPFYSFEQRPVSQHDMAFEGDVVKTAFGYAQVPVDSLEEIRRRGFVGMILRRTAEEAAQDAHTFSKTPRDKYYSIQVNTDNLRFFNNRSIVPSKIWGRRQDLKKYWESRQADPKVPFDINYDSIIEPEIRALINQQLADEGFDGVFMGMWGKNRKLKDVFGWYVFPNRMKNISGFSDQITSFKTIKASPEQIKEDVGKFMDGIAGKGLEHEPATIKNIVSEVLIPEGEDSTANLYARYIDKNNPDILNHIRPPSIIENITWVGKDGKQKINVPYYRNLDLGNLRRKKKAGEKLEGFEGARSAFTRVRGRFREFYGLEPHFWQSGESIESSIQAITNSERFKPEERVGVVDHLRELMLSEGFRFRDDVPVDQPLKVWLFTNDQSLPPIEDGTVMGLALTAPEKAIERYKGIKLRWEGRRNNPELQTLFLNKHPDAMQIMEATVAKYFTRRDKRALMDQFLGTTKYLSNVSNKVLTPEVISSLRGLGYRRITFELAEKGGGKRTVELGEPQFPQTIGELSERYKQLQAALDASEKPPEGVVDAESWKKDEISLANEGLYDVVSKSMEGDYYNTLLKEIHSYISEDAKERSILRNLITSLQKERSELRGMELGGANYKETFRNIKHIERDIEQVYRIIKTVKAGGLEPGKLGTVMGKKIPGADHFLDYGFYEGRELLALLKTPDDYVYYGFGGRNIESNYNSFYNTITVNSLGKIKEIGGDRLVERLFSGELDRGLLQINYARRKLRKEKGGKAGQTGEELRNLNLPDEYFKVEQILREGMQMSQRFLSDSGFKRDELFDYIGRRAIDRRRVVDAGQETFVKDLMLHADGGDSKHWRDLFRSFSEGDTRIFDAEKSIDDVSESFERRRKIVFKGAESEHTFMQKYGHAGEPLQARWTTKFLESVPLEKMLRSLTTSNSNVMNGFLQSAQRDSSLAAVSSVFGTRPHLALDVAGSVLDKKRVEAELAGEITEEQSAALISKISRSKVFARQVVNDWLVGSRSGVGYFARGLGTLRSLTNSAILLFTGFYPALIDPIKMALQAERVRGVGKKRAVRSIGNYLKSYVDGWNFRFQTLNKEKRQKLAALMNVAMSADTKDYLSRYEMSAPGVASWLQTMTFRMGATPYLTDLNSVGLQYITGAAMAERLNSPWSAQGVAFQNLARTYQITPEVWELVRKMPNIIEDVDGVPIFSILNMRASLADALTPAQALRVGGMFDSMFQDFNTRGVVSAGKYSRVMFGTLSDNPEGIMSNLWELARQYKGVSVEEYLALRSGIKDLEVRGQRQILPQARYAGALMAFMAMHGIVHGMFRDMAVGKTPHIPDWENPGEVAEFLQRGLFLGGGVGFWGDFLSGSTMRDPLTWAGFFTGPSIKALYKLAKIPFDYPSEWPGNVRDFLNQITPQFGPLQPLLLNTFFLDSLGDLAEWRFGQDVVQRRKARNERRGQEYFRDAF